MSAHDDALFAYEDRFGKRVDMTTLKLTDSNSAYLVKRVSQAIKRGKPFTREEETDIERTTYKSIYDRIDKGERILL